MFFFIWLLYYSYRWSTDWSSIDLLLILSGLLCFAGDWWFLDMLDGGCMGMSLSAGNFRWVVLWMCLETLPTQEVSPEGGSSCLKLGSGISSRFSHPGHGLRYDKVTKCHKMSQNSTVNIGHADSQPLTGQLGPLTRWNLLGFQCHLRYSCKLLPTLGRCCCKLAANAGNCGVSAAGKPPGHLSKFTDAFPFSSRPKSAKALARPIKAQKFCSKPVLACSLIQKPCRCLFTNSLGLTQRDN